MRVYVCISNVHIYTYDMYYMYMSVSVCGYWAHDVSHSSEKATSRCVALLHPSVPHHGGHVPGSWRMPFPLELSD